MPVVPVKRTDCIIPVFAGMTTSDDTVVNHLSCRFPSRLTFVSIIMLRWRCVRRDVNLPD